MQSFSPSGAHTLRPVRGDIHTVSTSTPELTLPIMRRLLLVAGTLVFIAGTQLYVLSEQTSRFFAWTVDPPLAAAVRVFFGLYAVILLGVGIGLFITPESIAALWAWNLTPLTGRAIGAWLLGLGLAAAQLVRENDSARVRPALLSAVALSIL